MNETNTGARVPPVERVLEVMAEVVAEYGEDHVYQRAIVGGEEGTACLYVVDGRPSCLAAHVLARLGVSVAWLASQEREPAALVAERAWGVSYTSPLAAVLNIAQNTQDTGRPWGEALAEAHRAAEETTTR